MTRFFGLPHAYRDAASSRIRDAAARSKKAGQRRIVWLWRRVYYASYYIARWKMRHGAAVTTILILCAISASAVWEPTLQRAVAPFFVSDERIANLRSLILTVGGGLVGAAAIVFSLVMFAMQINIARMPHGLFRRFSTDRRLLGAFTATFLLAIALAALSLFPDRSWVAGILVAAAWGTGLILILFLYAYRRALFLINPAQQLRLVFDRARRELRTWVRRARRAAALLEQEDAEKASVLSSKHDMPRLAYFQSNPHWTATSRQAMSHAISFARRYAAEGDYEVSRAALATIVALNAAYVEAKGKTFFTSNILMDNPRTTDGFINETLEHLRQNAQIGISRADEQQIEQTLQTIASLVQVYMAIDYATDHAVKTHANLAAGYLSSAVVSVAPHAMPDVLMEGVRLMGQSAQLFLTQAEPTDIATLAGKIAIVAGTGIARDDHRAVTLVAMEQLATLTFNLLRTQGYDIHFAAGELRQNVSLIARLFLTLPDTPLASAHSTYLGPYYSSTSYQALPAQLTQLTNALLNAKADDAVAQNVIRNFEQWSEKLYSSEKELLLATIQQRSHFTFDVIHWIVHVTKLLLAISSAPACSPHIQEKLREHAIWLVSVLSWIPDDIDAIRFVETFHVTEAIFDVGLEAHRRDCVEISTRVRELLLSWMFKAGGNRSGWGILERSVYALATLVLVSDNAEQSVALKTAIAERLTAENGPDRDSRNHAAREIRERAATLYRQQYASSRIEFAMTQLDDARVRTLLLELANLLSPGTAREQPDE